MIAQPSDEQGSPLELERRVVELQEAMVQLQTALVVLLARTAHPPVRLDVGDLHAERLEFHLGDVAIGEVSGQLTIGLTQVPGGGGSGLNPVHRSGPSPRRGAVGGGPPYDLIRDGDSLVLMIALPGVGPDDFRISLVGNRQVHVDGTYPYRHPVPKDGLAQSERPYGAFGRTITLPLPVDATGATVSFDRGVLTARLPLKLERLMLSWEGTEGNGGAYSG